MPTCCLVITDPALHSAVDEQLKLSGFEPCEEKQAPDAAVIIIDEAAADARLLKKLVAQMAENTPIFLLGTAPEAWDEFITEAFIKPVRLGHLIARLKFHTEAAPKLRGQPVTIGPYMLQARQRMLTRETETVRLTEKETSLLEYLAQNEAPVGREELLAAVWGYDARIDTHTLETHIYQLRKKIGNELILNDGGSYRLAK